MLFGSFSICAFFSAMSVSASESVTTALFAASSFAAWSLFAMRLRYPPFFPEP
jgi:hypothetical protein